MNFQLSPKWAHQGLVIPHQSVPFSKMSRHHVSAGQGLVLGSREASPAHWHSFVPWPCWAGQGAIALVLLIPCDAAHFSLLSGPVPFWGRSALSPFKTGQLLVAAALGLFGLPQIICLLMKCDPLIEAAVSFLTLSPVTCGCSADSSPYFIRDNCFHV